MHTPARSTQQPAAIAINSAPVPASAKGVGAQCDHSIRKRRAPRRGVTKVAAWRKYYAATAAWYDELHQFFAGRQHFGFAATHCATERDRYLEGVRQLDAGQHPNQIAGVWK